MSTYSADKHQHFDDLPDMSEELAAYNVNNYKSRKGRKGGNGGFFRPRNVILIIVAVIVIALIAYGVAFALSARQAKNDANLLMTQGKTLVNQLKSGDTTGAEQTTAALNETVDRLKDEVDGPLWSIATCIPVYGEDVKDVRVLASVANTLCDEALTPIMSAVPTDGLKGVITDGGINVPATVNLLNALDSIRPTIQTCADEVETMSEPNFEQLQKPVATVKDALTMLDGVSENAKEIADCLPGMLGADGAPSIYLVTAATNAEPRPRGGMPGAFGLMKITDGKIEMGDFLASDSAPRLEENSELAPSLTNEEIQIFGTRVGLDIRDSSFIPNFPRAAELEASLWVAAGNGQIDGIVMLDPVFLQWILSLIGGVTTSDGTHVDGTNAAQMLMKDVYINYSEDIEQDYFFGQVASLAFDQVVEHLGDVSPVDLLEVFSNAAKERRLNIWMTNSMEEDLIIKLGFGGETSTSEENPVAGIYIGLPYGAKSGSYLDLQTSMGAPRSNADGTTSYDVEVVFANMFSPGEDLPWVFAGIDGLKQNEKDIPLDIFLYAPAGGSISDVSTEGKFYDAATMNQYKGAFHGQLSNDPLNKASYEGIEIWYGTTRIEVSDKTTIKYTITVSPQAITELVLDVTPLMVSK